MKLFSLALIAVLVLPILAAQPAYAQQAHNVADPAEEMIFPVVRFLSDGDAIGTAFLFLHKEKPFVITARHCVFDEEAYIATHMINNSLTREEFVNEFNFGIEAVRGNLRQGFKVKAVHVDPDADFAILRVEEPKEKFLPGDQKFYLNIPFKFVKLASDATFGGLKAFDPVFVVGFPLGLPDAKISQGVIFPEVNGNIGSTAPVVPGNSGSPIFDARTHEVIGVVTYLYIFTGNGQMVTHINGSVPITKVRAIISSGKLDK